MTPCGGLSRSTALGVLTPNSRIRQSQAAMAGQRRNACGNPVGRPLPNERSTREVDVAAQTVRGLRNLGFGGRESHDAVRAAGAHVGCDDVESLLRSALERLTRNSWEKAS